MMPASASHWQQEGAAQFATTGAFYRPKSKIARDLAVLAASLYRLRAGQLRVIDAMTGCGVRPLRYCLEAKADFVWANEANPDLHALIQRNLSVLPASRVRITHQDARAMCFSCYQNHDFFDLVDIDNFGAPSMYLDAGLWATRKGGLLYLTSTDGRSTGGHDPQRSLRCFGAYARSHRAVHEQGLRLLIGQAAQVAASRGMGIKPVFSLFTGQVHRAMVQLVRRPTLTAETYGFIAYCHHCGHFQTVGWKHLGRVMCPNCQPKGDAFPVVSGPLWIGPLHGEDWVGSMKSLAEQWGWQAQTQLLAVMEQEATLPPYYYPLGSIGHFGAMDIPNRDRLIEALHHHGFRAAATHLDWQAVKTDATFGQCIAIAKTCSPI
jgi:tRNA (guanine26-N2/guanine27-N2)-dimethyltransferase